MGQLVSAGAKAMVLPTPSGFFLQCTNHGRGGIIQHLAIQMVLYVN